MAMIACEECGKEVSSKAPACPACGAPIGGGAPHALAAGGSPVAVVTTHAAPKETTYYTDDNGIRITNSRAIIGGRTFSMANLTTVTVSKTVPPKGGALGMTVIGGLIMLVGFGNGSAGAGMFGLVVGGIGIAWLSTLKDVFNVCIGAAGGETNALSSQNREYIEAVAHGLNEAIVRRG